LYVVFDGLSTQKHSLTVCWLSNETNIEPGRSWRPSQDGAWRGSCASSTGFGGLATKPSGGGFLSLGLKTESESPHDGDGVCSMSLMMY
jgi:hypothetical protein